MIRGKIIIDLARIYQTSKNKLDFIRNILNVNYENLKAEVADLDNLCILKSLNYYGNNRPDYRKELMQDFYSLIYFPAYFIEYYSMYAKLLSEINLSFPYRVLSFGTGMGCESS